MTFSHAKRGSFFDNGSSLSTSAKYPFILPSFIPSTIAWLSTSSPRAVLIIIGFFLSVLEITSRLMMCFVLSFRGVCSVIISDSLKIFSKASTTSRYLCLSVNALSGLRSKAMTFRPSPWSFGHNSRPIAPSPIIPAVLPIISIPVILSHLELLKFWA